MTKTTKETIINKSIELFAVNGYEGFSMRRLSEKSGIGLSSIYHFFKEKDELLREIFKQLGTELGEKRSRLPNRKTASKALDDRVRFQFENIESVVFVLKYYLHFRNDYEKHAGGYLPAKAYLHIDEVLKLGIKTGEFNINPSKIEDESKVVAHAINGFLLEYYPHQPNGRELNQLIRSIHRFLMRSLSNEKQEVSV